MGSGKTQLSKRLLRLAPRAVVLDAAEEYEDGGIFQEHEFERALKFFRAYYYDNFHLIYRGPPEQMLAWMDIIFQAQSADPSRPLAIITDEASSYSSSHNLDSVLDNVYTKGRRAKINVVTIIQYSTQIHPIIRNGSHVWVALKNKKMSTDTRQQFTNEEMETIRTLQPIYPDTNATEGVNYLVDEDVDLFRVWRDINIRL